MEVLDSREHVLCNYEVMLSMQKVKDNINAYKAVNSMKKQNRSMEQLATITYETLQYLEDMPTKDQSNETVTEYTKAIKKFGLNRLECLMLVNMPPLNMVDICVIVEDGDTRLSDAQMNEILKLTRQYFPWTRPDTEENGTS